jgi:hypothetical protein
VLAGRRRVGRILDVATMGVVLSIREVLVAFGSGAWQALQNTESRASRHFFGTVLQVKGARSTDRMGMLDWG